MNPQRTTSPLHSASLPQTNLYEDLEIDSIDAIDLIDHIKRETGSKLQAEDFRNVRTVEDVVQAVLKVQA
ncbi:hypothetical protein HMPREF2936_06205 [Neisseria sp. HMSC064F04]|uniref:Acyl carrier family protein n=1 Tax=Neisseria mucosa (strain ATCC 25996 / DSM 4631 / NCTC 10774 / M26) TaxID=546266 RepID=D3A0E6_NEIM2|nr:MULTISPECIES: acyl carrier protein [Neisseria]EFC87173.1 acyl carrier family protein [Neisseria mucosa ATCC 25996]OFM97003.1 hypothetical protein HMPREF2638_06760 [Neisseria sp. HMSC055F11]OFN40520.1 hypothetical protein HMPREF2568_09865 [Neisseria sp. HMSC059F02]OHR41271.1 hypothetical protein HMPREF2936_06205 [Neisseria sp. HMSC064F04]SUA37145.1 acyl carrier protein [Neisseria mucosa]